ncbi:MAG: glucose-6-phosphate isomerase [Chloroflexi bacterium]|jgi:glucose-6-phosphate isomerase|nr:glucose-6-phosphate isomerase [Chloroflexota bacterium]
MKRAIPGDFPIWYDIGEYESDLNSALTELQDIKAARRIWNRDGTLWQSTPQAVSDIENRLGWLDLPDAMLVDVPRLQALALEIRAAGITQVVLLGMGGSSLAPEVMRRMLGVLPGYPELTILDSTDPAQIAHLLHRIPLPQTLFLVSSKSGTTSETMALFDFFRAAISEEVDAREWARHFVAITDPGTQLAKLAQESRFRSLYLNPPDIGGRYSALSLFGLVPAALIGQNLDNLLQSARAMAWECRAARPVRENSALILGAIMGELARHPTRRRDKLTILTSAPLSPFTPWLEQLIAESTGKEGVGILPVEAESGEADFYGPDRLFVYLRLGTTDNEANDSLVSELIARGHPVVVLQIRELHHLGAEFYRWEFATAIAGQRLGINPFDQPNVESAKQRTKEALATYARQHALPAPDPVLTADVLSFYGPAFTANNAAAYLDAFLNQANPGDYVALLAFLERNAANEALLREMSQIIGQAMHAAVTIGFGPRFLHSTGQLHKGGPNTGLFIQITQDDSEELPIPGHDYSFSVLKQAQALGDWQALQDANRRVIRVNIGHDVQAGLQELADAIRSALT